VDLFGNRTELLFRDVRHDGEVAPDAFEIRVPDGTEVIDLR
jgi:outer membrane lipoprotein-sorting protein